MKLRRPACATLLLAAACETLIGAEFDDARRRSGASLDAGFDAGQDGSSCDPIHPPAPPGVPLGGADVALTSVITTVDWGDEPPTRYLEVGYDLDGRCTEQGDPAECMPEAWAGGDPKDGIRGQDNGVGKLLASQAELFGVSVITSTQESDLIKQGNRAPFALVRVSGYSAFSDDAQVRVEWYPALRFDAASGAPTPKLDGTDAWPVAAFASDADAGAASVVVDDAAYVSRSTLVAHFAKLRVALANVWFDVTDVVLTATLNTEPPYGFRRLLDGVVAGRVQVDELLRVVPFITESVVGVVLCTDTPTYPLAKRYICSVADIPFGAKPRKPGVCDGVAFGMAFQTDPALVGSVIQVPPQISSCLANTDPANDSCSNPEQDQ